MKSHSAADARPNQLQKRCTTKSIAKKSPTGSLPPALPLAITPTFRPWTHTSDDSYIYQLSLVVATATVQYIIRELGEDDVNYLLALVSMNYLLFLGDDTDNQLVTFQRFFGLCCTFMRTCNTIIGWVGWMKLISYCLELKWAIFFFVQGTIYITRTSIRITSV